MTVKPLLTQVDRIVFFENYYDDDSLMMEISNYRQDVNRDTVVMDLQISRCVFFVTFHSVMQLLNGKKGHSC